MEELGICDILFWLILRFDRIVFIRVMKEAILVGILNLRFLGIDIMIGSNIYKIGRVLVFINDLVFI